MYKVFKGFDCRTVKGTNLEIRSGTILKSYVINYNRNTITLNFPDMTAEIENDFDIAEFIIPMAEEDTKAGPSFMQQKDRTYRHGITKKYAFVDNLDQVVEDCKDEENKMTKDKGERSMSELENIKVVLDYLKEKSNETTGKAVLDWVKHEIEQKEKEYKNLSIVNADDKEIISQALFEMSDKYRVNNQFDATNKIDAVRERFLADETGKYVKTNLNNYVKVKLNDYGKKIHHDDWEDICKEADVPYELKVDEEGYSEFQIFEFMNTFGEHAHMGAKPFLETNDILIERSKK